MEPASLYIRFGVALLIGFLVGLQREYAHQSPKHELSAGIRTFPLIGLIGCAAAFTSNLVGSPWPFSIIALIFGTLLAINFFIEAWRGDAGLTTEVSAILTFICGALAFHNQIAFSVGLGVAVTFLLSFKFELHTFAQKLTRSDILSTLKFAVISAIVLPILPNKNFGPEPFNMLNPYKIWLLVVFISGISFVGYILIKIIGPKKGIGLTGFLGGLASSTAVTLSFTQKSKENGELSKSLAFAIIVAWTIMFIRVLIVVAAINSALVKFLWIPILAASVVGLSYSAFLYFTEKSDKSGQDISFANPFELGPAIKFGLFFSFILIFAKAAQLYLGSAGVYLASIVSGFADVDVIALSMSRLSAEANGLALSIASRAIVLACVANTITKGIVVLVGGSLILKKTLLPGFLLMLFTAIGTAFLL